MGEEVAKKEMARRTGLSVPTVRKYLKMIEGGVESFANGLAELTDNIYLI